MSWYQKSATTLRLEKEIKEFMSQVRARTKGEQIFTTKKKKRKPKRLAWRMAKLNSLHTVQEKLDFLKEEARQKPWEKPNKRYKSLRAVKFDLTSKYCAVCGGKASCMHHIHPLMCGGKNKADNLIPICKECHEEIHPFIVSNREKNRSIKKMRDNNPAYTPPEIRQ